MKKLIAINEDEPDIIELIEIHLTKAGFSVKGFPDGKKIINKYKSNQDIPLSNFKKGIEI